MTGVMFHTKNFSLKFVKSKCSAEFLGQGSDQDSQVSNSLEL